MRLWTLAFLCGVILLQQFSALPSLRWIGLSFVALVLWKNIPKQYSIYVKILLALSAGFSWSLWYAHTEKAWQLASDLEGKPVTVTGYIASIPNTNPLGTAFLFQLESLQNKKAKGLIRLLERETKQALHVGDEWQFIVKLKKTHGTYNPGGFDYEAYAYQEGIKANGYVVPKERPLQLSQHWYHYSVSRLRQSIKDKIEKHLKKSHTSQWITALTVGERNNIPQADWEVLRNTGTNHLMAIAGLHIGCMSALAHFFMSALWRRQPSLALRIPAVQAGSMAALLMGFTYSAMAGFSIPTQRACLMLTIFLLTVILRRYIAAWQAWSIALLGVLLWNPLTVLTESFWLSFGSVALIIYGMSGRVGPQGLWWEWGRIQWVIAIGLLPLSIWLFQQFSLVSFIANSIAIPWVGCVVVPLSLLGCFVLCFSQTVGIGILSLSDHALQLLWIILVKLSHLPHVVWYQSVPPGYWLMACVGIALLLAPAGMPARILSIIWLLPLILFQPATPKAGTAWFTLLDVGQGLSAVIQTQHHVLVYDAGPKLGTSFDMGESVVVPYLREKGVKQVDTLVVSHGDNDHIGGTAAILAQFPVHDIITSAPEKLPHARYCLRGQHWQWDGVMFEVLYPSAQHLQLDNDSSCVVRITVGQHHLLLTGDIEKFAEKNLVSESKAALAAEILVAPHHGSKTSGREDFIDAIHPSYVLFAVGYRNRYHFPHPSVRKSYIDRGAKTYETAKTGAMQFELSAEAVSQPQCYRQQHPHYWHNIN